MVQSSMKGWWWDLFTVETPAGDGQALNTPELTRSCTQGGVGVWWGEGLPQTSLYDLVGLGVNKKRERETGRGAWPTDNKKRKHAPEN